MIGKGIMDEPRLSPRLVQVTYTNYKGETSERLIFPQQLYFGSSQWHPDEQWLLDVVDVSDLVHSKLRTFVVKDITNWRPYE